MLSKKVVKLFLLVRHMKKNLIITLFFFISIFNSTISKALNSDITLREELAIVEGIHNCWSIPFGMQTPNLSVSIKLELRPDGTVSKTKVLDQEKMNKSEQTTYRIFVESILRAIKLCQPLKVPITDNSYKRWKKLTLNAEGFEGLYLNFKPDKLAELIYAEMKREEEKKRLVKADNFLGNCNIGNERQYLNTALQLIDEFNFKTVMSKEKLVYCNLSDKTGITFTMIPYNKDFIGNGQYITIGQAGNTSCINFIIVDMKNLQSAENQMLSVDLNNRTGNYGVSSNNFRSKYCN